MIKFYRNALGAFFLALMLSLLTLYAGIQLSDLRKALLPPEKSFLPWLLETSSDKDSGGLSTLTVNDATESLDFDFNLTTEFNYPYVTVAMMFEAGGVSSSVVDLSPFSMLSFKVSCSPQNVLTLGVYTLDATITVPSDPTTYRVPTAYFPCVNELKTIEIDLKHLEIPEWWLTYYKVDLSNRGYRLDKTVGLSFGVSLQSPKDKLANVKITELSLHGRDERYRYVSWALILIVWGAFIYLFFSYQTKALSKEIKRKLKTDRPFLAYQQLSIQPQNDKEKSALLRLMATEYANPELSLEYVHTSLGINRVKINDILKDELDLTFSVYLNKLRLTEAARLLSEMDGANVAEIAYSVGYNNVSYFNKLFKSEYGCPPKVFKSLYQSKQNSE